MPSDSEWGKMLLRAVGRALGAVDRVVAAGRGGEYVGVGASGDRTLAADSEAENEILASLSEVKGLRVVTEEAGEMGAQDSEFTAVVDPVDGSSNLARGIPFYCTAVAILEGEGIANARAAAVRNLVSGDVYLAVRGKGATKNGARISTSAITRVREAVAAVDLSRAGPATISRLTPLLSGVKRQVHFGANALELCTVAEGATDLFVDVRTMLRMVDFAAAYLIVKEAGGVVTGASGEVLEPEVSLASRFNVVASANERLHAEVLSLLR